ncbi:(Fe-S)-binding protein [Pyrofollis japonicus]|uniref:(Fe-S)-binding protein n=1 Tax=Pyrofollis japonicus TaxID=3060460 RepID=UPI00295AF2C0|nr:(Fe-S)-binding protein [Pyrofollis japonicus]BEP17224.1 (Fe-S)-binding protein [Pyrofollis japonicus]
MVLDARDVISMIKSNMEEKGLPLPIDKSVIYEWSKGLDLPKSGDYLLYTGGLYQLLPYIESLVNQLEKVEKSKAGGLALRFAKKVMKIVDVSKLVSKPDKEVKEYADKVLKSITILLKEAGISFYYDPELDGYSGALLYDMGLVKSFKRHAENVYRLLNEKGVKRVITIDPHTTHMLRSVYPKVVPGYNLEVKSYLELLAERTDSLRFRGGSAGPVVIHDPCLYARFENVLEEPRKLLSAAGYEVREPRRSGKLTYCCGGPVESLAPTLSKKIASNRIEELKEYASTVATLCPICFANLHRVAPSNVRVVDISILLVERLETHGS